MKIKESDRIYLYLDLVRNLKKLWNMLVTVILIVIRAIGMVSKDLEKKLGELETREKIEIIQTKRLLQSVRIL